MTDSVFMGSVIVVGEVASGAVDEAGFPELPAVPHANGEGEQALADAPRRLRGCGRRDSRARAGSCGLVDRLDPLTDAAQLAEPWLLVCAVGTDERGVEGRDRLLE